MITLNELLTGAIIHENQGFAVYYYEKGQVLEQYKGKLHCDKNEQITNSSNFRLASVSKQFIAYSIVDLIYKNKLSYNTKIIDIYPDLPKYFNKITIRNLLNHTSGIYNYESIPHKDGEQVKDRDILTFLKNTDNTYFEVGSTYKYSNTAYVLLGLIIEDITHQSISEYIDENIFKKAHMDNSKVNVEGTTIINHRAMGHLLNKENKLYMKDQSFTSATIGDGGLYSSINDLKKWCLYFSNSEYFNEMKTPNYINESSYNEYGLGIRTIKVNDKEIHYHCGDTIGTNTLLLFSKDLEICLLFLTNLGNIDTSIIKDNLVNYLKKE